MVVTVAITAAVVRFVVVPQFTSDESAFTSLTHVAVPLVVLALLLELGSLAAYSALTATVLGPKRPRYRTLLRIDLVDLGVNHVVPGGGTTSGPVRVKFFEQVGIPVEEGASVATIEILGSNVVLGLVFAVGILMSLTTFVTNGYYLVAAVAVLVVLAASAVGGWLLVAHTDRLVRIVRWLLRRLPAIGDGLESFVRRMAADLRSWAGQPKRTTIAIGLAAANWLLDAAALGVTCVAFGHAPPLGVLLTVYGLGSILMMVPFTPGGIGLVEGVMVPAFVAFGIPAAPALLGVLGWRVLQYWMPMPVALAAYVSLRLGPLRRSRRSPA